MLGMKYTDRIMVQSLLSKSFQTRGRGRVVTQEGQYKKRCAKFWGHPGDSANLPRERGKGIREEVKNKKKLR